MMNLAQRITEKFEDRRIRLNVGGVAFETMRSTLRRKPSTRLAQLAERLESDDSWDGERREYFFDRHPGVFSSILHSYRTEDLHTEHNLCGNIIKTELEYWGLTELDIEPCCWGHYCKFKENKKTLTALDDNFTFHLEEDSVNNPPSSFTKFKRNMWIFLEDPSSSRGAKAYAIISMFFVLLSIAVFVLETHPIFRVTNPGYNGSDSRLTSANYLGPSFCSCKIQGDVVEYNNNSEPHEAMTYLDYLCAAFFTLEFLVRIFFAPNKLEFFKQPLNIIDILCLVPHFTSIIIKTVSPSDNAGNILRSVLALRVIRVLRIFKLMKHYTAFKILVYTIKVSTKELLLMVVFLFSGVLIFASVIYYVENNTFNNIPIGFWWAIVTMTTVGYGDKVPFTEGGYILGFLCVLCGVLTVAFTVPIVVNNFTLYYAHAQSRNQLPPQKKRELQQKLIMKNQKATEFIKRLAINVQQRRNNNTTTAAAHRLAGGGEGEGALRRKEGKAEDGEKNFNPLEDLKTPRTTTSRNSKDSGIDACLPSPPGSPHKRGSPPKDNNSKPPLAMTEADINGSLGSFGAARPEESLGSLGAGRPEGGLGADGAGRPSSRIQTVSEIVPDLEMPGTPDTAFSTEMENKAMIETEQLLHTLQDLDEKKREERRRQLNRMNQRRDEVRARATPRPPNVPKNNQVTPRN